MEYKRIHKPQTGMLSPSKLTMRLTLGTHHLSKKNNTTIIQTTPDDDDQCLAFSCPEVNVAGSAVGTIQLKVSSASQSDGSQECVIAICKKKAHQVRRADSASAAVHPTKSTSAEDDQSTNHECDSNASSSSFEFPNNGERARSRQLSRSFSRPASSKWNDAEKWIMSRPSPNNPLHRQTSTKQNQLMINRMLETKTVDSQVGLDMAFSHANLDTSGTQSDAGLTVRAVSMRDMGTEMTPMASQDPSRASTPMGATTPLCSSPSVSIPCTPGREPPPKPGATDYSDGEGLKLKTRREIIALGVQLGKKNIIAALAAEQEENLEHCTTQLNNHKAGQTASEFEYRAAAWEQAEKTKHEAIFKREEVMIQVWENRQKAKLEAEMRRIEAKVEEMRFQCQNKMLQKIATATHRSETKRAKAEARKNQEAQTSAAMAGYIRRKGHIPYTYMCCGWA